MIELLWLSPWMLSNRAILTSWLLNLRLSYRSLRDRGRTLTMLVRNHSLKLAPRLPQKLKRVVLQHLQFSVVWHELSHREVNSYLKDSVWSAATKGLFRSITLRKFFNSLNTKLCCRKESTTMIWAPAHLCHRFPKWMFPGRLWHSAVGVVALSNMSKSRLSMKRNVRLPMQVLLTAQVEKRYLLMLMDHKLARARRSSTKLSMELTMFTHQHNSLMNSKRW